MVADFDEHIDNKHGRHGDDRKYFPDMVACMDKLVGKVMEKLTALGLRENTLVVVMGGNGTKECFAHILPNGGVYPGGKGSTSDNGIHVPLILSQPGAIPTGTPARPRSYDGLVALTDIHPTISQACGIPIPNAGDLDGISFWPQPSENRARLARPFAPGIMPTRLAPICPCCCAALLTNTSNAMPPTSISPQGPFFHLRSDPLETGGTRKVKAPGWEKYYHCGPDLERFTPEPEAAFDRLGTILDANQYVAVKNLKIQGGAASLTKGDTPTLRAEVSPANATRNNVIWDSSDPAIASIDKFGLLTAHKPGRAKVSVYSWDDAHPVANNSPETFSRKGISASISINVH